ncbi:MAG: methylated-DNA--[protein]-cysteine S-methyltransferase [Gammaproteobacteria bacterium]|nr:methylated-DNA--[protein]-cysteine S-methyltransferase [Gammaproteobacteria bacterium]MYF29210.1 methylated-DNA--[protein]-cysteine S-methyltransferase [Gammaproteobacteria bacterium]MYK47210.1 methylated-DNA--[protein]-cysteine S-methyltransferase [Gammaproteobacteria bacterium]
MYYTFVSSPIGQLLLAGSRSALKVVGFASGSKARSAEPDWERNDEPFMRVARQLGEYFDGKRRGFDLPVESGASGFQADVLDALSRIPYGETRSYGQVASDIGRPKAVRAVGAANGRNPLPIVIPCHRVIGHDGDLTGFGGGLAAKRYLLDLERRYSGMFKTG